MVIEQVVESFHSRGVWEWVGPQATSEEQRVTAPFNKSLYLATHLTVILQETCPA